ncbi:MAG: ABC transporter ATP-binding protein, partial [Pseudonocardia sp.]|nr:ABC transporter ATP-binding protein [Pseudonocardia sp.]
MTPTAVLRGAARGQRRDLVLSSLLVAGHQLSEAAVPVVVGVVLDLAVSTGDATALARWLTVVAGVFVVLATSAFFGYWLAVRTEKRAAHGIRLDVVSRVLHPAGGAPGRSGELV